MRESNSKTIARLEEAKAAAIANDAEKQTAIQQEQEAKRSIKVELEELQRYAASRKAKELVVLQASLEGEKDNKELTAKAAAAQQLRDAQTESDRQKAEEKKIAARKAGESSESNRSYGNRN